MINVENLLKKSVEYFYEDDGHGGIQDSVHALGIVFDYVVPEYPADGTPAFWSTRETGMFDEYIRPGVN